MKNRVIYPSVKLFSLEFFQGSVVSFVEFLNQQLVLGEFLSVCTPNPEQLVRQRSDLFFAQNLQQFDVCVPDGVGVSLSARILTGHKLERIAGVDIVSRLLSQEKNVDKILVIGGREYDQITPSVPFDEKNSVFELTAVSKYHQVFWLSGYQDLKDKQSFDRDDQAVKEVISQLKPDIILVALGAPDQEAWVVNHRDFLVKQKIKLAMVVGGAFDILLGKIPRSPKALRHLGLEWLYRLACEPWRWRRQLALIKFPLQILQEKFKNRG